MKRRFLFRRPDLFFFGCCALVLAAGSAAVFAAIFAAPERAVDSHSALPAMILLPAGRRHDRRRGIFRYSAIFCLDNEPPHFRDFSHG